MILIADVNKPFNLSQLEIFILILFIESAFNPIPIFLQIPVIQEFVCLLSWLTVKVYISLKDGRSRSRDFGLFRSVKLHF